MKITRILLTSGFLAASACLSAQTLISFSGTASEAGLGYEENEEVSFTFVLANASPTLTQLNQFGQVSARWEDHGEASERLIQSVSGTGITGTWLAPILDEGATDNSYFQIRSQPAKGFSLSVNAFDYSDEPVNLGGLEANGFAVGQLLVSDSGGDVLGFDSLPESGNPIDFLSGYTGTFDVSILRAEIFDIGDTASVEFSINRVTISAVSPVPEPSTYAAICGGLVLAGAILRRRRRP